MCMRIGLPKGGGCVCVRAFASFCLFASILRVRCPCVCVFRVACSPWPNTQCNNNSDSKKIITTVCLLSGSFKNA